MKKFLSEFKAFISKGNVLDLAVGVIIGGAFSAIVTSLTDNIINPIIALFGGTNINGLAIQLKEGNEAAIIDFGAFISSIINFLIMALIIFIIVKAVNKAMSIGKKEEEIIEEATTKICPYCKSEIDIEATKCPHCTSDQPEEAAE